MTQARIFSLMVLRGVAVLGCGGFVFGFLWDGRRGLAVDLAKASEIVAMAWASLAPTHRKLSRVEWVVSLILMTALLWAVVTLFWKEDLVVGNVGGAILRALFLLVYLA